MILLEATTFGYSFVPSQAYVSSHDMIAKSVAIPVGCLILALCCRKFAKDLQSPNVSGKTLFLSGFGILVLPLISGVIVRATILTVCPLWSAALIGQNTQLEFSVDYVEGPSFRCPDRVNLAGMPTMTGTLCGVADDFRKKLYHGVRVVLTGRGTADGLFVAGIDVAH
ncbi:MULTISPECIES: hypothetical protein [unclassified Mesorhizobium]|uniref:hypothetical protein n=1 Tax=unclassified Mesorhizobium TaxID=325217 RepID=UPI000F7543D4|nr:MULTISPECIES: hypothetical protein [unclassified Mesorhizobium]AZO22292.1 hypothetical protein EJ070_17415 [Mesorhizobium sp. M1E.F.Ca.ET.045.02.1.1]RUW37206.1 hypothetical protein EOA38_04285 [Mesorhizobium sp. M1E.F.Ca.ET.041.01.1.1]RUW84827.1 hypothetical protein EOA29_07595 [Mesorhizobium sp. M1E.F.Ca.ET.063.01.1.1]RWD87149.1 MAG: hypothetical protein EOS39_25735 [Mesorhizobium sp.]RWD88797.1 MAG: hypothetical protein EOS38_13800 [Mesorhizobium sp.]